MAENNFRYRAREFAQAFTTEISITLSFELPSTFSGQKNNLQ